MLFSCGERIGSVSVLHSYEIETLYYETRWYQLFVRHTPTESGPRASTPPAGAGMPLWLL